MAKQAKSTSTPLVSVLVLAYNEKQWIPKLLASLRRQTFKNFEIIIVDNGSTDGTAEFIKKKFPKVKLVQNKKNLGTPGYNAGLTKVRGDYILFIATDMEVDPKCIAEFLKVMKADKSIALCGPKVVNFYDHKKVDINGTWLSHAFYGGAIRNHKLREVRETPFYGIGLIRKSVVEKIGHLYDPDYFFYGEDVDLCLKIRLMGMKVVAVPSALIYHYGFQAQKLWSRGYLTFLIERNQLTNFLCTFSFSNLLLYFPLVFGARLAVAVKDLLKLDVERAFARLSAVFWVLTHPSYIIQKRRISQGLRTAPDSYVFKVINENHTFKVIKNVLTGRKWN